MHLLLLIAFKFYLFQLFKKTNEETLPSSGGM